MDATIALTIELAGVGIVITTAVFKFYTSTIKKLQNHEDRLSFIEKRLDRIENKIDRLNNWISYNYKR